MFCHRCGTEVPRLARECPACGAPVSGLGTIGPDEAVSAARAGAARQASASARSTSAGPIEAGPSIVAGGLDTPGPPRDALGRFVLVVAVALAADQLLPWVVVNNATYMAMTEFGLPAVLVVLALGAAIVPLVVPAFRVHPVWSTLPFASGCLCLGFGIAVWLLLAPLANLASAGNASGPGVSSTATVVILPHWGLYLFVLGSLVLIGAGYRLLRAAREAPASLPVAAPQRVEVPAAAAVVAAPLVLASASVETQVDGAAASASPDATAQTAQTASLTIPLPGSPSWNEEPALPAPLRSKPAGPWRSQSVSPRGR